MMLLETEKFLKVLNDNLLSYQNFNSISLSYKGMFQYLNLKK